MKTRCPYPECLHVFEIEDGMERQFANCPACGERATFKSFDIIRRIDREYERRLEDGTIFGVSHSSAGSGLSVLVEDVRSLWNVGSILRTADGAGFDKVYLAGITGAPPRKEIAKTSLGAEDTVPWEYCPCSVSILRRLKDLDYFLLALEYVEGKMRLSHLIRQNELAKPLCLIVGNEVTGVSRETLSLCDEVAILPMRGVKESLNVAVAFGIAAYMLADAEL